MTKLLTPLAVALAAITATSVGMAVHALIADPVLAWMFCGAAVLLDVFKYAAWPAAAALSGGGRKALSACLVACAVTFAGVSGWATFDRVVGAVEGRIAGSEQRLVDLADQQAAAERRIETLDAQLDDTRRQAAWMRERGMASKSMELESGAIARADAERKVEVQRLERLAIERQSLLTSRGTRLPGQVTLLLGLGFALALEVVPVLIFLAGVEPRRGRLPEQLPAAQEPVFMGNSEPEVQKPVEEIAVVSEGPNPPRQMTQAPPARNPGPSNDRDAELMAILLQPGRTLPKVKDFAKTQGIGNTRASALFKAAEAAGHITKTPAGYVLAEEIA